MRFSKRYIWQRFLFFLPGVIILLCLFTYLTIRSGSEEDVTTFTGLFGINNEETFLIVFLSILVIYAILDFVYSYFYWKKTKYEITDREISLTKGVFFKREIVIDFKNIHAVNIDRNLLLITLGMSKLCIDSGNAQTSGINEIEIFDLPDIINQMEKDIKEKMTINKKLKIRNELEDIKSNKVILEDNKKTFSYTYNRKMRRIMVFLSSPFVFFFVVFLIATIIINIVVSKEENYTISVLLFSLIGLIIFFYLVSLLSRLILHLYYYNFKLSYDEKEIVIEFGLLHQRKYIIAKEKIKGLSFKQYLIHKLLGYGSIEVHMVGLMEQNEDNNASFVKLLPFVEASLLNKCLEEVGIKERFKISKNTCRKNSFIYFLILPLIIFLIIALPLVIVAFIFDIMLGIIGVSVTIFVIILIVLLRLLCYNNQSIDFDNDYIYLSNGYFEKQTYVIPWQSVVTIGTKSTFLREKKKLVSIVVSYYSDKIKTTQTVCIQDVNKYGELLLYFESIKNK